MKIRPVREPSCSNGQ